MMGLGYRQIGERMGLSTGGAYRLVCVGSDALSCEATESIEAQRNLELARLDHATTVVMSHVTKLAAATKPNPAAVDQLVRISERRSKLLGLDSATEVLVTQRLESELAAVVEALRGALDDAAFAKALAALGVSGAEGAGEAADDGDATG
jgi:hypothetical protein